MTTRVFIADLRHNYSGVLSTDCMPLGIGYIKAVMDQDLEDVDSSLFAYPDHLWEEICKAPPDVLMLTNYMWCEQLGLQFARSAKALKPDMLVVMGGPNLPLEDEKKREFMLEHPELDVYCLGEGDFFGAEIVTHYQEAGGDLGELGLREIESAMYRRPDGEIVVGEARPRRRGLDEIPSPFLTGIMDDFFDGRLAPMIETNRGCPFQCSFCVQGEGWWSKVNFFGKERIREEIFYIAEMVSERCPAMGTLRIADSNYGMYKADVDISSWIGEAQAQYGYPTFIDATTGKNQPKRIIESLEKVNNALVLYQAVQSLDEDALRNIRRSNIKADAYEEIMIHVRGRGLRSSSDLILGLPGETLEGHIHGIHQLVNAGTHEMHNFQSMLLAGADLSTTETRAKHQFVTRFRVLPKNFGIYAGEKVMDFDEIVVAHDDLSFEEYVKARTYHFVVSLFWNNSWFEDVIRFARTHGIAPSDWLDQILVDIEADRGEPNALLQRFVDETRNELFESREECREYYSRPENWQRLKRGEIGDNLMYKYRAQASFFYWPQLCELAMGSMGTLLLQRLSPEDATLNGFWRDMSTYTRLKHAHGETREELLQPVKAQMEYDIAAWLESGLPAELDEFHTGQRVAEYYLPEEAHAELAAAIDTWGLDLRGMTKGVTRMRSSAQVRAYTWLAE